jgi:PEP-CTERM motif
MLQLYDATKINLKGGEQMRKVLILVAVVLVLALQCSFADDLKIPSWRGQDGTTFHRWEFGTDDPMPVPDEWYNPYSQGLPPDILVEPGPGMGWLPEMDGRLGVWQLSGHIDIDIWNRPEPLPLKIIQIQMTWSPQPNTGDPLVVETNSGIVASVVDEIIIGNPWIHTTYRIILQPNPEWEHIQISGDIDVDELVIDTICTIPEPGTVGLIAIGVLALVRRKK